MSQEIKAKIVEQEKMNVPVFSAFGATEAEHNRVCDSMKDGNYKTFLDMQEIRHRFVKQKQDEFFAKIRSPPKVYKSVPVWRGEGVIHAEKVMNYALTQIHERRCIEDGCHAQKFKNGKCRKHSKADSKVVQ